MIQQPRESLWPVTGMYVREDEHQLNTETLQVEGESKHARHKVAKLVNEKCEMRWNATATNRKKEEKYRVKVKLNSNEKYELNGGSRRCSPTTKHGFNKIEREASHEKYKILKIFSKLFPSVKFRC